MHEAEAVHELKSNGCLDGILGLSVNGFATEDDQCRSQSFSPTEYAPSRGFQQVHGKSGTIKGHLECVLDELGWTSKESGVRLGASGTHGWEEVSVTRRVGDHHGSFVS